MEALKDVSSFEQVSASEIWLAMAVSVCETHQQPWRPRVSFYGSDPPHGLIDAFLAAPSGPDLLSPPSESSFHLSVGSCSV